MKRTLMCSIVSIITVVLLLSGCTGKSGSGEDDQTALRMTYAKTVVEKYLTNVKYSNNEEDWVFTEIENNLSIVTNVSLENDDEKKVLNVVVTPKEENKFVTHFVEVGGTVYFDDGTIE